MHAPGLWSWTVGDATCLYHEAPTGIVVADPLVPDDEAERFWRALDRDVARIGTAPTIVVSSATTVRSAGAVWTRYPGSVLRAPRDIGADLAAAPLTDDDELPGGLVAIAAGEVLLLRCPCHGLLWTGNLLHGGGDGELVAGPSLAALTSAQRSLLATRLAGDAIAIAIPARGAPVIAAADDAVARALA